jgi:hypothetical protein
MKKLSDKQTALIAALGGEAGGNIRRAMDMAGYSKHTRPDDAIKPIRDEVIDSASTLLAMNAHKAALGLVGIIDDPSALGARNVVSAAKEVLDRAGVIRREQIEMKVPDGAVFILPPKQDDECLKVISPKSEEISHTPV